MSYMKRLQEQLANGEVSKRHVLEPGGKITFKGAGYPAKSMFNNVDIAVDNNKKYPIMLEISESGIHIELMRKN